jgi:hypothetical protein
MNRAYDIECLPNLFMVGFADMDKDSIELRKFVIFHDIETDDMIMTMILSDDRTFSRDRKESQKLDLSNFLFFPHSFLDRLGEIVDTTKWYMGFNSIHYDDHLLRMFLDRVFTVETILKDSDKKEYLVKMMLDLYETSKNIIEFDKKPDVHPNIRSIDLKKVARIDKSLKLVGANLGYPQIMDFPVNPHIPCNIKEAERIMNYLSYDLEITKVFGLELSEHLNLRKQISLKYGVNVMTLDDTGIASVLFEKLYCGFAGIKPYDLISAKAKARPDKRIRLGDIISPKISFRSQKMQDYLKNVSNMIVKCDGDKITFDMPEISIGDTAYTLGGGGIHSVDNNAIFVSDGSYIYTDCDVTSYYVYMIINDRVFPEHLDENFCRFLETIVADRVAAKKSGDKVVDKSLKTVILSIFGKMGEKSSPIYSPRGFLSTTVNGQLYLLMLAEMLEYEGIKVVSANTDGIVSRIQNTNTKHQVYQKICKDWMDITGFNLEFTEYSLYARTTVNDYFSVTRSGETKHKGDFVEKHDFAKGHHALVIPKSVNEFLKAKYVDKRPVSIESIVENNNNILDYLYAKKPATKGWAHYILTPRGTVEFIPDTVRFCVVKKSFNHRVRLYKYKVSDGIEAKTSHIANEYVGIANTLFDPYCPIINDIKKDYYIKQCKKMINQMESGNHKNMLTLFD